MLCIQVEKVLEEFENLKKAKNFSKWNLKLKKKYYFISIKYKKSLEKNEMIDIMQNFDAFDPNFLIAFIDFFQKSEIYLKENLNILTCLFSKYFVIYIKNFNY